MAISLYIFIRFVYINSWVSVIGHYLQGRVALAVVGCALLRVAVDNAQRAFVLDALAKRLATVAKTRLIPVGHSTIGYIRRSTI